MKILSAIFGLFYAYRRTDGVISTDCPLVSEGT